MATTTIKETICKGCGLCVTACPKKILRLSPDRLNEKGYAPAELTDSDKCIACGFCFTICPDCAITIK